MNFFQTANRTHDFFRRLILAGISGGMSSLFALLFICFTQSSWIFATEERQIGMFTLQFTGLEEAYTYYDNGSLLTGVSSGAFNEDQKKAIAEAAAYWAERIIPNGVSSDFDNLDDTAEQSSYKRQVVIKVVFSDTQCETSTFINTLVSDATLQTTAYNILTQNGNPNISREGGYDALIVIGTANGSTPDATASRLHMDGDSLTARTLHELGHILGITGSYTVNALDGNGVAASGVSGNFGTFLTPWEKLLADIHGNAADGGQTISIDSGTDGTAFHLSDLRSAYASPTVGSLGLPVAGARLVETAPGSGDYYYAIDSTRTLIHPDNIHSIMNDYGVRNSNFLQIELAVFEEMGYTLDREGSYGATLYHSYSFDGETPTAVRAWASAEDWESPLSYAVGLHLLCDDLTFVQEHALVANGTAAGGIRIDGCGNTLFIDETGTVAANGERGTGVLVSYGNGNVLVHRGRIEAMGVGGYGVQFEAPVGDICSPFTSVCDDAYSGNYYDPAELEQAATVLRDLDGPLVSRFDITGTIIGAERSISIGREAYVAEINVMSGAALVGNIVSEYIPDNPCDAATTITFGRLATESGSGTDAADIFRGIATNAADPDFRFRFDGEVHGKRNIDMHTVGGITTFTNPQVYFRNGMIGRNSMLVVTQRIEFGGDLEIDAGSGLTVFAEANGWHSLLKSNGQARLAGGSVSVIGSLCSNLPYEFIQARDVCSIKQMDAVSYAVVVSETEDDGTADPDTTDSDTEDFDTVFTSGTVLRTGYTPWSYWYREKGTEHTFLAYAENGGTWNEYQIAGHLDTLRPTARNDMEYLQAHLDVLLDRGETGAYRHALDELGGEIHGSLGIMQVQGLTMLNNTIANSLRQTHLCVPKADCCDHENASAAGKTHKYDAWAIGYGLGGQGYADGNAHKLDYGLGGTAVGIGTRSDRDDRAGFYFSYARSHLTTYDIAQSARSDDFFFGGFLKLRFSKGYLLGLFGGGFNRYDVRRHITYLPRTRRASGDHCGGQASFYLESGFQIRTKIASIQPYIGLQYVGILQDRFNETGAGAANLRVDRCDADSLRMMLGGRVYKNFRVAGHKITADVHGAWMHEYLDKTATPVRATFTNYGGASFASNSAFTVRGLNVGRDWGLAGLAVQADNGTCRIFFGYDIQVNENMILHAGHGGLVYGW